MFLLLLLSVMPACVCSEDLRDDGIRDRSTCRGRHSSRSAATTSVGSSAPRCYSTKVYFRCTWTSIKTFLYLVFDGTVRFFVENCMVVVQ